MTKCFSVGQYSYCINGSSRLIGMIPDTWKKYESSSASALQTIAITLEEDDSIESDHVGYDGWFVQEKQNGPAAMYFQKGRLLFGLRFAEQNVVTVFIKKALDCYVRLGIQHALMISLLRECVGLHGVTLLCGNEIIILSAPSGTGKTTLGKLLEKYSDAIIINGDFALLTPTDDGVIFEPTPFCGSSGRCLNHRVRVNRVVFLEQGKTNEWRKLEEREAIIRFMSNAFVPTWDGGMQQAVQENILKCISMLKVNLFSFAPTQEAAEMFLNQLSPQ